MIDFPKDEPDETPGADGVVLAKTIGIEDDSERTRATLNADDEMVALTLTDARTVDRISVGCSTGEVDAASVLLRDSLGVQRMTLAVTSTGQPVLAVHDYNGEISFEVFALLRSLHTRIKTLENKQEKINGN